MRPMLDLALLVISVNYRKPVQITQTTTSCKPPPIQNIKNFPVISLYLKPVVSESDYFSPAWLFKIAHFLTLPEGTDQ